METSASLTTATRPVIGLQDSRTEAANFGFNVLPEPLLAVDGNERHPQRPSGIIEAFGGQFKPFSRHFGQTPA